MINTGAKVFVIGGETGEASDDFDWKEFGDRVGVLLGNSQYKTILCSAHESSIDFHVIAGISKSQTDGDEKVIVHHPENVHTRHSWKELVSKLNLTIPEYNSHDTPEYNDKNGEIIDKDLMQKAYLLCQLQALDNSDVVVIVGGKVSGSAIITISLAIERGIPILPLPFFGGAARYTFNRISSKLIETFGKQTVEQFKDPVELEKIFLPMLETASNLNKDKKLLRVFISYSWRRAETADFIEATLRRRSDVVPFRDEKDIKVGKNIRKSINDEIITNCDIFIALWCSDYVQSPYCYDEVDLWMKHRSHDSFYILQLDGTRAVWPKIRDPKDTQNFSSKILEGYDKKTNEISREKVDLAIFGILKEHVEA